VISDWSLIFCALHKWWGAATSDLRILIFGNSGLRASVIEDGLREKGHVRACAVSGMTLLLRRISDAYPDVVIIELE